MNTPTRCATLLLLASLVVACGSTSGGGDGAQAHDADVRMDALATPDDGTPRPDGTTMLPDGATVGPDGAVPQPDGAMTGPDGSALGPVAFRRGDNTGYYGPGIDRREAAQLAHRAGANSLRTTFSETYLDRWGDTIEVGDYAYYSSLGIDHHVCFLVGANAAHSSAPAGTAEWELAHFAPRNLYEPIFLADGSVNPNNYWAAFVARVARNYGDRIDIYEVWNEPDQVGGNWMATMTWATQPPRPQDLVWWNDTVYAYVRALRVTHEVVHRLDPTAQVTVGGLGYSTFLRAVLRYTDEPTAGRVTADYPRTGGAYLDVMSYHYYPVFGGGSSDRGVDGFFALRDEMQAALRDGGVGGLGFVVTESGAPRYALGTNPGGVQYAANYLIKMMTLAHFDGFVGVDWFAQGDGAAMGASMDPFQYMGLYFDYSAANTPADVRIAPQGEAYAWLASWLEGTAASPTALTALALPSAARGAAFVRPATGAAVYVLWARATGDETATTSYALRTDRAVRVRTWAPGAGESVAMRTPAGGSVMLTLGATPQVVEVM